jgi:hypothetical protein
MAERTAIAYKRLFEIRLLHHYWLDEGNTVFDLLPSQADKDRRLLTYDVRKFLSIVPTASTDRAFNAQGCIYKQTTLGCVVAVPASTIVPADAVFEFITTVENADFFNYTTLTLPRQTIYELYYVPEDKTYRYKENIPVLSNLTGALRGTNELFLSKEIPPLGSTDKVESLVLSGNALLQLTSDQPAASTQQLNPQATTLPVFVHQGDVPEIVPPVGLMGAPERGIQLSDEIPDTVFALVRIAAMRPDNTAFNYIQANGLARDEPPIFQIRLKNRSTVRKYYNKTTKALIEVEPDPLPLTQFGNAGTKQKPSGDSIKVTVSNSLPLRITEVVSEIFM